MEEKYLPVVEDWDAFLAPYNQAIEELKIKLKGIRLQYRQKGKHAPIEFITGRVKTPESIREKMQVRKILTEDFLEGVQDIAGLRIMCQFVDDILKSYDYFVNEMTLRLLLNVIISIKRKQVDIVRTMLYRISCSKN